MVTELPYRRVGLNEWELRYESDQVDPLFRIYKDGILIATTLRTSYVVHADDGEIIHFDVTDGTHEPAYSVPSRATVWWQAAVDAVVYAVQKWIDSAWEDIASVFETGEAAYKILTDPLENLVEHVYRIIAYDEDGNPSDPLERSILHVRRPDPTVWSWTYDEGTGNLTITITS